MGNVLVGKKTYVLVALGAVSALVVYAQTVIQGGFDFNGFIKFVNSEAIMLAFATLRQAIAKK